eukprot:12910148-Prorocentrum_lima.AAC.1
MRTMPRMGCANIKPSPKAQPAPGKCLPLITGIPQVGTVSGFESLPMVSEPLRNPIENSKMP